MMQPIDVPQALLNELAHSSPPDLIARFSRYDFRDALGHPLENCLDFLGLVALASQPDAEERFAENAMSAIECELNDLHLRAERSLVAMQGTVESAALLASGLQAVVDLSLNPAVSEEEPGALPSQVDQELDPEPE